MPGFRAGSYFRWPSYGLTVIVLTNREDEAPSIKYEV